MDTANNNNEGAITGKFNFCAFYINQAQRKMKSADLVNSKTNEPFAGLIFPTIIVKNEEGKDVSLLVTPSSKLGKFTKKEALQQYVIEHKEELQIVKIENPAYKTPLYSLCKIGDYHNAIDVDLGI